MAVKKNVSGYSLFWLSENQTVYGGQWWPLRARMFPEHGSSGGGTLVAPQRHHRNQVARQHVYVQGQSGFEAHFSRRQVSVVRGSFRLPNVPVLSLWSPPSSGVI